MAKTYTACNWVTEEDLNNHVATGALAKKEVIHWRVPGAENPPEPKDGEVIVFTDHLSRGFSPPGSKFFRDVLHFFQLHPQDIEPNSVSTFAISKCFVKLIFKRSPQLIYSKGFTI